MTRARSHGGPAATSTATAAVRPVARSPLLRRRCACDASPGTAAACDTCRTGRRAVQRQPATPASSAGVPPIVYDTLRAPGQPLEPSARASMESRFGHDFSRVRVHTDPRASESARAVNALAYTVGRDVVFAAGHYAPGTAAGRRLLAHELTHVVQQPDVSAASVPHLEIGAHDASEIEAEAAALVPESRPASRRGRAAPERSPAAVAPARLQRSETTDCLADPLAYGVGLSTRYPGWLTVLPNCPCTDADAKSRTADWEGGIGGCPDYFHPGAVTGYRSKRGFSSVPGSSHGQQCCYDAAGRLITSGPGAGTPDVWSPKTNFLMHQACDVQTWQRLGWATYNRYWIPNDGGGGCAPGDYPAPPENRRVA